MPDNNENRIFPSLSWSRFNANFPIPESDDAARVAAEVRTSVDAWIQTSLQQLEDDMSNRANTALVQLRNQMDEGNEAMTAIQQKFTDAFNEIDQVVKGDKDLEEKVKQLKEATQKARQSMADAAKQWEQNGKTTVSNVETILATVAKIAAA